MEQMALKKLMEHHTTIQVSKAPVPTGLPFRHAYTSHTRAASTSVFSLQSLLDSDLWARKRPCEEIIWCFLNMECNIFSFIPKTVKQYIIFGWMFTSPEIQRLPRSQSPWWVWLHQQKRCAKKTHRSPIPCLSGKSRPRSTADFEAGRRWRVQAGLLSTF